MGADAKRCRNRAVQRLEYRSHFFIPEGNQGSGKGSSLSGQRFLYKYHIDSSYNGYKVDKADPFAFFSEAPPRTGSLCGTWSTVGRSVMDGGRHRAKSLDAPIAIYEMQLGSWMRGPEEGNRPLTYREIAPGWLNMSTGWVLPM